MMNLATMLYNVRDHREAFKHEDYRFVAYCMKYVHETNSQLFQDLFAMYVADTYPNPERLIGNRSKGFFVDFGATDGRTINNSFILEKRLRWNGICVEPNPTYLTDLSNNRNCHVDNRCVAKETGKTVEFLCANDLSTISEYIESDYNYERRQKMSEKMINVETVSLNDLLIQWKAPDRIDFISMDSEGSEYDILSTFDFNRWKPRCFSIEHNYNTIQRDLIYKLMIKNGYTRKFEEISRWDDFYIVDDVNEE